MKKVIAGVILSSGLFSGLTSWSEPIEIAPKSSVFYEVKQQSTDASELNIQVRINMPKVGGVKAKALYIKLDGTTLKPDRLVERDATDKMKDGRTQIYVHSSGGISVPYAPSAEAFDKDARYSLANGKSAALYKFNLGGLLMKSGENIAKTNFLELRNETEDQTIIVELINVNGAELVPAKNPPVPGEVKLQKPAITYATPVGEAFSLRPNRNSQVEWRGTPLIESDRISYFDNDDFNRRASEAKVDTDKHGWTVVNCRDNNNPDFPFRKELGVSPDGKTIELNVQFIQLAYKNREDMGCAYSFKIPLKTLVGMNWKAKTGRTNKPASTNGTLRADSPENFIGDSTRWLVFEGNGKSLVFDFNPEGVQTYSDFGPNRIQGLWTVKKIGDYVEFSFGRSSTISGGTLSSKVVIFEGGFDDYANSHAYPKYAYYSKLPINLNFCFGAPKHGAGFIQAGNKLFNEDRGFGWSSDVEVNSIRPSGALYSAAHGTKPATFKCAVPQPGVYLVTARVGTGEQSAGPFSVSVPGKDIAKDITVSPKTAKTVIWPQWIENGTAEFTFSGNWRISSIALQLLQHAKEDYTFRRGFWRISDFYEPSIMLKNSYHAKPPEFKVAISETPLPMAEIKDTDKAIPLPGGKTCLPDQQSPAMAWRFNANIGSMGPNNWGNFDEFNTKELVQRRLSEIEKSKIDTILLNGNHSRHTFPDLAEHTDREIKRIVTEAHQKNIKVIDHMELNLLWNMGSGFRYLTEHTDWLERTVDDGVPTTVLCPVKPAFKKQFFDRWIQHIKDTGIDGFMIDEQTFAGAEFCGCDECRRQFHEATGLTLPLDETSPLLLNKNSNLWKSWLNWRIRIISDWVVELKEQTKLINPNLTFMRYTTHYGFYSNYSTHDVGASLSENARGCDFLGTEIMSRNVMESCRGVYAFRKLKYSLREAYGSPIFGLVYPQGSMGLAYFGWALNNMNNQATWFMEELTSKDDVPDFTAFTGNMDRRLAAPAAETAILFSTQSRDWAKMLPYYVDPFGFCQTMNDLHRQYTVLIEPSLNQEKLRQYQTLIAPSASSLSDAQIAEMLTFAENGGTLVLTAHAGMFDEMGNAREVWPFSKALGIANPIPTKSLSGGTLKLSGGNSQTETQSVFFKLTPSGEKTKALATLNGETVGVETPYGKGRIFYISGQIGRLNMEDERTYTQKWTFTWDQSAYELQKEVLNTILGESQVFIPVNIPRKVFASVYNQEVAGKKSTVVHLLNGTGVNMKAGQTVGRVPPTPPFPPLAQDIKFKVKSPGLKTAYVKSPDFEGAKPVEVSQLADGWYEVTVPPQMLKCYSLIWLEN